MCKLDTYTKFDKNIRKIKNELNKFLKKSKISSKIVVSYGAPAKGNTLLNCLNLSKKIIQFASENNTKKIGKYTPGTHIKIISDNDFCNKKIDYAILLSWNYKKFFLSKSRFIKKGGKFIVPLPEPHIK